MINPSPEELRRVAEFVFDDKNYGADFGGNIVVSKTEDHPPIRFVPHLESCPAWQWQAIYDALKEEHIHDTFARKLGEIIDFRDLDAKGQPMREYFWKCVEAAAMATPAQRYRALRRTLREAGVLPSDD